MIVEKNGKETETNFFMFDGASFQVWGLWTENDPTSKGQMTLNIDAEEIKKIIVVMK